MITHIVCWNFKDGLPESEKKVAAERIKKDLEALKGQVEGLLDIEVLITPLSSSNRDIALICHHSSQQALEIYQTHPKHLAVVEFVRSVTCDRVCFDY